MTEKKVTAAIILSIAALVISAAALIMICTHADQTTTEFYSGKN